MLSLFCSGFFVIASAVLFAATLDIPGAGEWDIVGSRLVPQIYIAGMALCSIVVFIGSLIRVMRKPGGSLPDLAVLIGTHGRIIVVFAALAAWIAGISLLGFYLSGFLFLLFLMWYLNDGHFTPAVIAVSLAAPAVIYFLFERGLKVLMPAGALFS
ncbi:MAG: tripartite tricarboxylate transporter TctB family protein [Sutterella sp.]|nr:tripartite tricarboxylate transporter TctB family protein [Sutterella sp.]